MLRAKAQHILMMLLQTKCTAHDTSMTVASVTAYRQQW
jgi:hypothetical protein